jgi:serine/threonine protein kinase
MTTKSSLKSNSNSSNSEDYDDRDIDWSYEYINNYLLINKLGQGAYCSVWMAYNCDTSTYCALKIYNREDLERGEKEILVYENFKNMNITNIVCYNKTFKFDDKTGTYLCADMHLGGYSVYDLIELFDNQIPVNYIYNLINQVINILNNIHNINYVHGDIKPENIILKSPTYETQQLINTINSIIKNKKITKKNKKEFANLIKKTIENKVIDDNNDNIKNYILSKCNEVILCDMGTAVRPGETNLYKKYTIYYRAPETILKLNYNHTYDYWSLGCSLYEILTGEILFDVENDLELLYNFTSKLGPLPISLLKESKINYLYYNKDLIRLRNYKEIKFNSIYQKLINLINQENFILMQKLINIIISCLDYNYLSRKI